MAVQLVVATGNRIGQIISVPVEKFIIGRADDCHLKARSAMISRYHCAILVGDEVVVRDLGSKNGVRLNGKKISAEQKLENGDHLVVGPLEFYVHIADDESVDVPADIHASEHISWYYQQNASDVSPEFSDTVLLDHLKSLSPATKTEPEQPVLDLVKKFL